MRVKTIGLHARKMYRFLGLHEEEVTQSSTTKCESSSCHSKLKLKHIMIRCFNLRQHKMASFDQNPSMPRISLILLICLIHFALSEISIKEDVPHVKLSNGAILSGRLDYSRQGRQFNSFVGIPYGKIPARFEESQLAPPWNGIFNATKQGQICAQAYLDSSGEVMTMGGEDCLNLNVYVPVTTTRNKTDTYPVIVMIHGGGFSSANGFILAPKYYMDEDVILVTINYRLSVFGFLSTGDLTIPGNNGMKDQILALRWIQENIQNFGGDPNLVTVCGISAGGASVHYLILSPVTNGLFHRAIAQSGNAKSPWAYNPNPRVTAVKLATYLKCPTKASDPKEISSAEILSCLKGLTTKELNEAQLKFNRRWPPIHFMAFDFVPVAEPMDSKSPFLTFSPWNITGPLKKVPFITGATENEGVGLFAGVILQNPKLLNELDTKWENIILRTTELDRFVLLKDQSIMAKKIRNFYFGDKKVSRETRVNLTNLFSDAFFIHPWRSSVMEAVRNGEGDPVYIYQYAYHGPASMMNISGNPINADDTKKASHADDWIAHFNMDNMLPGTVNLINAGSPHEEFSRNIIKLWVSFSIHGKPNHTWGNVHQKWSPISKEELERKSPLKLYKLDSSSGYVEEGEIKKRVEFWEKLYSDHVLPLMPVSSSNS